MGGRLGLLGACTVPPSPVLSHASSMVTPQLSPKAKTDLKLPSVEGLWGNLWAEGTFFLMQEQRRELGLPSVGQKKKKKIRLLSGESQMQWP